MQFNFTFSSSNMFKYETKQLNNSIFGKTPIFLKEKDVTNNFIENYKKYPQPIPYGPIRVIKNSEDEFDMIEYTDCFEISLLRFLHLVFSENDRMNLNKIKNLKCEEQLNSYFSNKSIYRKSDYYETIEGFNERTNWCNFLNNRDIFKYNIENKYEVCASLENLFNFFSHFFNISFKNENYKNNLENLGKLLSTASKEIRFELNNFGNNSHNSFYMNSYIKIFVNNDNLYDWVITQYFNFENNQITERVSGHSDYRNSIHVNNFLFK